MQFEYGFHMIGNQFFVFVLNHFEEGLEQKVAVIEQFLVLFFSFWTIFD